jgi:hypothetical protein
VGALSLILALASGACTDAPAPPQSFQVNDDPVGDGPTADATVRTYERRIVFMTEAPDSSLVIPWFFTAHVEPEGVRREVRGWLARDGTWESFFEQGWRSPPMRAPWRPLPRGPVRLVVGHGDALEDLIYEEGARSLEVSFGSMLAEWTSTTGDVYRLHEADALVASGRIGGVLLDLSRTQTTGERTGGWAFLVSGDSLQMIVDGQSLVVGPDAEADSSALGFARLNFRRLQWPQMFLTATDVLAYERARRDVPVAWRIRSVDGSVDGTLEVVTTEIEAGAGSGPLLPVYALFEVTGEISIEGGRYPVRGVLRYVQP